MRHGGWEAGSNILCDSKEIVVMMGMVRKIVASDEVVKHRVVSLLTLAGRKPDTFKHLMSTTKLSVSINEQHYPPSTLRYITLKIKWSKV